MATLTALITRAQSYGYGTDTQSTTALLEFANEEIREIYMARPWQFREGQTTLSSAASSYLVSLTAGIGAIQQVTLVDGTTAAYPLEYLDPAEMRRRIAEDIPAVNGLPAYWSRWAGAIYLFPRPNKVYSVFVDALTAQTADIATGTECPLPFEYEDVVVLGMVYRMAVRQRDQFMAEWAFGKRGELFAILARDDDERQRQRSEKVVEDPSRWGDWNAR